MKRAALYGRVSTDEQAAKGYSLPSQMERCQQYAEAHGFSVVAEITDDYTGTRLDRPGLDQVRTLIRRGEVNAVIVYTTDRWTRKLAHLLILREEMARAGVELHFVNKGKSENTPESRMAENIEGVFNEYWRERIVEAARRGMRAKARSGKVVGLGHPPYGYRHGEDGTFEVVEAEAEIARLIYRWYTYGDENGEPMAVHSITRRLSEMGITTPGEKLGLPRIREPGMWKSGTIHRILTSETYCGVWRYGKRVGAKGRGGTRPEDEQILVPVPLIVSREEWEAAQARREYNRRMSKRNCKREYLLRGRVKCGCGSSMTGEKGRRGDYYYYRCSRRVNRLAGIEKRECTEGSVRGDVLDVVVWEYVLDVMTDRDCFEQGLRGAQEAEQESLQPRRERLDIVTKLISECEMEAREFVHVLAELPAGGLVSRTAQEKIDRLEKKHAALVEERDPLLAQLDAEQITDENIAAALVFREAVIVGMQSATFEDKRRTLEDLRVQVVVKDKVARVTCRIPMKQGVFDLRTPWRRASPPT